LPLHTAGGIIRLFLRMALATGNSQPATDNPIKVVIWDLDDTFWRGTLSEGAVEALEDNLQLVRDTAARGIVHTIVSKNDFAPAEAKLVELGIRDLFVFPQISWQPKGPIIKQLLEQMQLRAPNALFLDDNPINRAEAQFYNPQLQVADPADLPELAPLLRASGKPDPEFSRLEQYKLLERQQQARAAYDDNLAFLRDAQVRIEFREGAAVVPDLARIEELINRSNQLNFTKRRVTKDELTTSFADPTRRWGTVRVRDRLGDYGLVGIYCLNLPENRLEQLVFSCRILHLGIEQFTYAHLGFPALEVQGDVATTLSATEQPNWITIETAAQATDRPTTPAIGSADAKLRVLLKGGCDLGQLTPFLQAFRLEVEEEFNFNNENQIPVHLEHTALLRASREWPSAEQQRLAAALPFLGHEALATKLWDEHYDVLVYSPLMDYTQELYREKATGLAVPFGAYQDLTAVDPVAQAAKYTQRRFRGMDEIFLRRFQEEFEFLGQISSTEFKRNLQWLRAQVPVQIPIFFLNGTEIDVPGSGETGARARHALMNQALEEFVTEAENCIIIDVRGFINAPADVTNNLRHYHRQHYRTLAQRLAEALGQWHGRQLQRSGWVDLKARAASLVPGKLRGLFK
jgi:FkbH-like protein